MFDKLTVLNGLVGRFRIGMALVCAKLYAQLHCQKVYTEELAEDKRTVTTCVGTSTGNMHDGSLVLKKVFYGECNALEYANRLFQRRHGHA